MKYLLQNQEARFNEILFENRNKNYGAYALRSESDRILTKSLFIGVGLLAAVSITSMLVSAFKTVDSIVQARGFELPPPVIIPDDPTVKPPAVEMPAQAVSAQVKTFDDRIPEPTANPVNERVVQNIEGAVAGVKNNPDGITAPSEIHIPVPSTIGSRTVVTPEKPPVTEVPKDPYAIEIAAVQANFEGGIDAFRNKVVNRFDASGFDAGEMLSTTITFIVETNGTITDLKANGKNADFNAEALRTVKLVKGKWVPGKNKKGEAVRSYFKFPVSMKFDQ